MNPWVILSEMVLIAVALVMLPVGLAVWSNYRRPKIVTCPVESAEAVIRVDALQAGIDAALGRRRREVVACSRWPDGRCRHACVAEGEAIRDAPVPARV